MLSQETNQNEKAGFHKTRPFRFDHYLTSTWYLLQDLWLFPEVE
ncbi:hypothetical protein SAMN04488522_107279 [Pedobacter caeni]|uniref:Uncharacterized protein n=1 Tax=Pedobacter caeni TaxID=288992 RepID=A0A1M5MRU0_9SPHI|nr:hypothetical protein SAMN04488522_107279 [Pedobacter caeni]